MKVSVYLHEEMRAILCCYGTLDDVVNKILDAGTAGEFDIMDKPNIGVREGARRFDVDIKNEEYLALMRTHPHNSTKISLRRLLYWFVENEMYEILGWEPVNEYLDRNEAKKNKLITKIRQDLESLIAIIDCDNYDKIETALKIIKDLEK